MVEIPHGSKKGYDVAPGTRWSFSNTNVEATEIVIESVDGLVVRFNLGVGQRAELVTGVSPLKIFLNKQNDALIGIPENVDQSGGA